MMIMGSILLLLVLVVGYQAMKLYSSKETETENLPQTTEKKAKEEKKSSETGQAKAVTQETNDAAIEEQIHQAVLKANIEAKQQQEQLKETLTEFTKKYYTYTSETAAKDYEKAKPYLTQDAQAKYTRPTDEKYEGVDDVYKQYVEDVEMYMDLKEKDGSFMAIVTCHGDSGTVSSSFPLIVKGQIVKEGNDWKVDQVVDGNPSNFPDRFFYE
jgi:hypothetical protein